ncbi:glyoxalase/bleomycin resistance/extradiol dioxygenase family protein [Lacticaseibacillus kribbianus]|uniref:glyoxalase/bleomycin resistance/extradiol dioxygenase family protein n=1 Tax=Lacticaseibacillus kribbianus TaxID=2926292 RepID=UPI001CD628BA|nr:glyoxalase/bleomycin resistance/extradiol dioxygenase family protein [Lacticaseibacillus kribbianus]
MQARLIPYIAYLSAKDALAYYQEVFGATDVYRLSPTEAQAEQFGIPAGQDLAALTMHGGFRVLGQQVECADAFNGAAAPAQQQIVLQLDVNAEDPASAAAADALWARLQERAAVTVTMPYEAQFWGGKMGQFTDKFGVTWMLHSQPWSNRPAEERK